MGNDKIIKIGILTSSRADYGIYSPLLKILKEESQINMNIIVFGTHLSEKYGYTVKQIENDGFNVDFKIKTLSPSDNPEDITFSMAKTITAFSGIWKNNPFDLIFALGDRYEMFAAVASTVPFNIPIAHIHGGETTLGAIDNAFRNSITCMSSYHFTSTEIYAERAKNIIGHNKNVFNVGALSIDAIKQMKILTIKEFKKKYTIDLSKPSILITFHPETIHFEKNALYVSELVKTLGQLNNYQQIITMPNADTAGLIVRNSLIQYSKNKDHVMCIESFGSLGYLSCMKHCSFMLGNTSSGFIEASYFSKPVINLGDRQKGRIETSNILTVPIVSQSILKAVKKIERFNKKVDSTIYGKGNSAHKIISIIKKQYNLC